LFKTGETRATAAADVCEMVPVLGLNCHPCPRNFEIKIKLCRNWLKERWKKDGLFSLGTGVRFIAGLFRSYLWSIWAVF